MDDDQDEAQGQRVERAGRPIPPASSRGDRGPWLWGDELVGPFGAFRSWEEFDEVRAFVSWVMRDREAGDVSGQTGSGEVYKEGEAGGQGQAGSEDSESRTDR